MACHAHPTVGTRDFIAVSLDTPEHRVGAPGVDGCRAPKPKRIHANMKGGTMKHSKHSISLLLVTGGLVVLLLSLLVGTPSAQAVDAPLPALTVMPARMPLYKITDLGSLAGAGDSYAYGINDLGHVVGKSEVGGTDVTHAFLWQGGMMIDLGSPTGNSTVSTINNYGMVVDTADVESECLFSRAPWPARRGVFQRLTS